MRVASLGVARPAYYDRNATVINANLAIDVAPHADTTRITITVAAGKKALIENVFGLARRTTAATVAGNVNPYSFISSSGGAPFLEDMVFNSATVGTQVRSSNIQPVTLYASDVLYCQTGDASTGGTVLYRWGVKATSYDA